MLHSFLYLLVGKIMFPVIFQRCFFILIIMNSCFHVFMHVVNLPDGFQAVVIIFAAQFIPSLDRETSSTGT